MLQGDLFEDLVSVEVGSRPIWVARTHDPKPAEKRIRAFLHDEDGETQPLSQGTFKWGLDAGGERVLLTGFKGSAGSRAGLGIVLSHDCEVEHDPSKHVVIAMVRPLSDLQTADQTAVVTGGNHASMYLPGDGFPGLGDAFIDFRRVTSYRQPALGERKVASMTELFRARLSVSFYRFLFRRLPGEAGPSQ